MSDTWIGKIVIGVVVAVIANTIISALNPPNNRGDSPGTGGSSRTSFTGAYCFDFTGMPRCPLLVPLPPGTPCFCPYQGTGYTGYL